MSLEAKSKELKELVSNFDTQWFLGDLSKLMRSIVSGRANDQLGQLSSPMRQLYFLGGLLITSDNSKVTSTQYSLEQWSRIIELLNEIELEYNKFFFPKPDDVLDEEWDKIRDVAMPSFLSYFNQGPLNYEEQIINWVSELYTQLDNFIHQEVGVKTTDFIQFYNNLDGLIQHKFQGFTSHTDIPDDEWLTYTNIKGRVADNIPDELKAFAVKGKPLFTFMSDHGIVNRFKATDLVSKELSLEKVEKILALLKCERKQNDFIYYTSTKPSNPLYEFPIVDIGAGLFQVFEVKQVIHAIEELLDRICLKDLKAKDKLIDKKGKLLEKRVVSLFKKFLKKDFKYFEGYYVDGCEQDILFLWKNHAFIIEAKGYTLLAPFRNPNQAYIRIKRDFKRSIGNGYKQTSRVEQKFIDQVPLRIEDKNGNIKEEIDTTKFKNKDFSIIVNIKSFGQIQNDLSLLLELDDSRVFPWAVKIDDLEVFLLTLIAKKKNPRFFIDFLIMREELHGKLICSDELEVCGGFLTGELDESLPQIITSPKLAEVFDKQYIKGMGFDNEKLLTEKKGGNHIFW